jgi:hypothetical protein
MALLSGNDALQRWEIQTVRTYLIRTAGQLLRGSRQITLKLPDKHLHPAHWSDWLKMTFIT